MSCIKMDNITWNLTELCFHRIQAESVLTSRIWCKQSFICVISEWKKHLSFEKSFDITLRQKKKVWLVKVIFRRTTNNRAMKHVQTIRLFEEKEGVNPHSFFILVYLRKLLEEDKYSSHMACAKHSITRSRKV